MPPPREPSRDRRGRHSRAADFDDCSAFCWPSVGDWLKGEPVYHGGLPGGHRPSGTGIADLSCSRHDDCSVLPRREPMQFGFGIPTRGPLATPEAIASMLTKGEELGYSIVTASDNVVVPRDIAARYPYS